MAEDRVYYVAAGESLKAVEAMLEQRRECNSRREAFADRFDATAVATLRGEVMGLVFDDPSKVPAKWREIEFRGSGTCAAPPRRSKADKEIRREMSSLKWREDVGAWYFSGTHAFFPQNFQLGDKWIISQHKDAKPPEGAILLKMSDYYRMVEESEAEKAA